MGRRRIPPELHVIAGTFRPDRHGSERPSGDIVLHEAPSGWDEHATEIFNEIARVVFDAGVSRASDRGMLELLAKRLLDVRVLTILIEDAGAYYVGSRSRDGVPQMKKHPAVGQRATAMRHLQSLLGEFGLSPATRARVSASAICRTGG